MVNIVGMESRVGIMKKLKVASARINVEIMNSISRRKDLINVILLVILNILDKQVS